MPKRVCPAWLGHFLANPIRKLIHPPQKILSPYVREGMTVLDIGCGMGFFRISLAQMVGPNGKVIWVDMQEKMLQLLAEPKEHVSQEEFTITLSIARQHGFKMVEELKIFRSRSVVLRKAQHQ